MKKMDVTDLVQSVWLTAQEVNNSPSKIATILSEGVREEVSSDSKGVKYQAVRLVVEFDRVQKEWRPNRYALKKLAERFGAETKGWVGKQIALTTMLMQGGKLGIVPA
jgi:hypothetical protein